MPTDDPKISDLIQASIYSLDNETSRFIAPRVLPIAICVDAGSLSKKFGEAFAHEAQALLKEYGYSETYQWGPFEGSHFTTIFGTGEELENGDTLRHKQETIASELMRRIAEAYDWRRAAEITGQSIKIAAAVGTIASILVPGPNSIVIGSFAVSAKVLGLLKASGSAVTIVEGAKKIFFENRDAEKTIKEERGERIPYPSPPDRIKIMRPLVFKAKPS